MSPADNGIKSVNLLKKLSKNQFFFGIPQSKIALAMKTCSKTVMLKKGDLICKQGETNFDLFVLTKGKCDVFFNKNKVAELKAVDTIGEMGFIVEEKRSATAIANEPCSLLVFNKKLFDKFLKENRAVSETIYKNVIKTLSKRIIKSNNMMGWLVWT